jgi:hypothetical protein
MEKLSQSHKLMNILDDFLIRLLEFVTLVNETTESQLGLALQEG